MRKFSIYVTPYYSFFSRALYVDVARRWRAGVFVYLLLVLALSWIPFIVRAQSSLSKFVRDDAPAVVEQIPPITIERGRVSAAVEQPHFIQSADTGELFGIIDTTGRFTSLDDTSAKVLLARSQLFARKNETETRVYDLSTIQHFYVDGPKISKWLGVLETWGAVMLYLLAVVGSYAYRLVQALFYSIIGLAISTSLRSGLTYGAVLRIVSVAITPAILVKTAVGLTGLTVPVAWGAYFLVAMAYTTFGISSNRNEPAEERALEPIAG
ncbi:MAG TPA: DUF1189 family protein [Candidatus Polarisedimenticolaceae bacterium]|nr:DUF1189 family protein [Candidatus Polarisedimenticolaceae bacterium]